MNGGILNSLLTELRKRYHARLCVELLGIRTRVVKEVPRSFYSTADADSISSVAFARGMAERMSTTFIPSPPDGQTAGTVFTKITADYLKEAFSLLLHVRPGTWEFTTSQVSAGIAAYDQYAHLSDLKRALDEHPSLRTALGGDYFITPDIVVSRAPLSIDSLNAGNPRVPLVAAGEMTASRSPLRAESVGAHLNTLHASVSCK